MWTFLQPINLLRYLVVLRVNKTRISLPQHLPTELSLVLGQIITERLPTLAVKPWRKALAPWEAAGGLNIVGKQRSQPPPEINWPLETVFFVYPLKRVCGLGEPITFELKLMGPEAEHLFFLETILPALEQAGYDTQSPWSRKTTLWGHFDIQAVSASHGSRWVPVVVDGQLNLAARVSPRQWAHGLKFNPPARPGGEEPVYANLTWLTPFDLSAHLPPPPPAPANRQPHQKHTPAETAPSLSILLDALTARMAQLLPGKYPTPEDVWAALNVAEQSNFLDAREQASHIQSIRPHRLQPPPAAEPGQWIGTQSFQPIPAAVLPYLELASILHLGKYTHFGNGTFKLA